MRLKYYIHQVFRSNIPLRLKDQHEDFKLYESMERWPKSFIKHTGRDARAPGQCYFRE